MKTACLILFLGLLLQETKGQNISLKIDLNELRITDKKLDKIRINGVELSVSEVEKNIFTLPTDFLISDSIAVSFALSNKTYVTQAVSTGDSLYPGCTTLRLSFISDKSGKVTLHSMKCGSAIWMYTISVYDSMTKEFLPKESSDVRFMTRRN